MTPGQLSPQHEAVLRGQVIDADHPGPLLHDFAAVLDYVGTAGVVCKSKYLLLPMERNGELNARLRRPLQFATKQPRAHDHPYLVALSLLLRSTGLSRLVKGSKPRLCLDPEMLARWQALNPTEQYFTLLEAGLLIARPEMVGQRDWFGEEFFQPCARLWRATPATGLHWTARRHNPQVTYAIGRDFHLLALLDLFGLMAVDHPREPVSPWRPAAVRRLPFGDAVFTLLMAPEPDEAPDDPDEDDREDLPTNLDDLLEMEFDGVAEDEIEEPAAFGALQPFFQPYFPAWQKILALPAAAPLTGVVVFLVTLGKIWRRIAIPAEQTLDDLVWAILAAVDFDDDHLYAITFRDRFGRVVHAQDPRGNEPPYADEIALGTLPLQPGDEMQMVYDFGDDWRFTIRLEPPPTPAPRLKRARVLEAHGKAPQQYPDWD